jgi:AcrR family transcriptional regulator
MDEIRAASGLPLRRIYQMYPTKEELVVAFLDRRDVTWRGRLAAHVEGIDDPTGRVLGVFDWLGVWFEEPGFRGCAWVNAFGELGATSPAVAEAVREHKGAFHSYVSRLAREAVTSASHRRPARDIDAVADAIWLLAEGAMVSAAIAPDARAALRAREATAVLLAA